MGLGVILRVVWWRLLLVCVMGGWVVALLGVTLRGDGVCLLGVGKGVGLP
jgi:hypothetical protein